MRSDAEDRAVGSRDGFPRRIDGRDWVRPGSYESLSSLPKEATTICPSRGCESPANEKLAQCSGAAGGAEENC